MLIEDMGRMPVTLLKRQNWLADEYWYAVGPFRAFWDRCLGLWTVTVHDSDGNQVDDCEYFNNKAHYRECALRWADHAKEKTT